MSNKVKPVSDLAKSIANLGLNFAENQVEKKITDPLVEDGVRLIFPVTRELLDVLNDNNPANAEQVRSVVVDWLHQDFSGYLFKVQAELLGKVDSKAEQELVSFAFTTCIALLKLYTDDNKDNKRQVKELLNAFVQSGQLEGVVNVALLDPALEKMKAGDGLSEVVKAAFSVLFQALKK